MSESNFSRSMRRESLHAFFEASPAARLLRSDYAPYVVEFLNDTFKAAGSTITLGQYELRSQLAAYQETVHELAPTVFVGTPDTYLNKWTEQGWIQRRLEADSTEPVYQLTRHAEDVLRFVDSTISKGSQMVGTESRLRLVIESLEDIVRGASADPRKRLEYLYEKRREIDDEIAGIEAGKSIRIYQPAQIRDKFYSAIELLKTLQSDFRAVEERFQSITRDVRQRQASGDATRGGILGYALDAEDFLKKEDEGISFFAFVNFLFSPTQQASLRQTIIEVQQLEALAQEDDSLSRVRRMVPALIAEADKVMKTTMRLSATLRRLLDQESTEHRRLVGTVLHDIKQAALQLRESPPQSIAIEVDAHTDISSPFSRTFWKPEARFESDSIVEHEVDVDQLQRAALAFARLQRLDMRKLRRWIREATLLGHTVTLGQLFERGQTVGSVVELLGLLQIAHEDEHAINSNDSEIVIVRNPNTSSGRLRVRVPLVTYTAKSKMKPGGEQPR